MFAVHNNITRLILLYTIPFTGSCPYFNSYITDISWLGISHFGYILILYIKPHWFIFHSVHLFILKKKYLLQFAWPD